MTIANTLRTIDSRNVVAGWKAATHAEGQYRLTAHWDHLGSAPRSTATGSTTARSTMPRTRSQVIARAFTLLPQPPKRSILFLSVTAEEQGLLGSRTLDHADLSLAKTLANINMDGLNVHGQPRT
jgi:hypothetical protein